MNYIFIRITVIIIAVITAYVIYSYIIAPKILEPVCLLNSNRCVRIAYYNYKNSILLHMQPTGFWVWFNGEKVFVFGQPIGDVCQDPDFEPVYVLNPVIGLPQSYECITKLEKIIDFYKSKNEPEKYLYMRVENPNTFSAYDIINYFDRKGIINLQNISPAALIKIE